MSRTLVPLFALVLLMVLVTPCLAQAPTPKVTITGLFDQVTAAGRNFYDANFTRDNDREWYGRTRFRPDFQFAVGRTKAVLGIELDLAYGQQGPNDGGFPGNNSGSVGGGSGGCKTNTSGCLDINTDVAGLFEIKWIYTEFDLTGKDSLMPFIPVLTVARLGGQPFASLASYKTATYANGDFAGVSTITTFSPTVKLSLAYVIAEDQLAGGNRLAAPARTSRGEDYAFIVSPEITPFKGLDIKPLFSWYHVDGQTSSSTRGNHANVRTAGGTTNGVAAGGTTTTAGDSTQHEERYTVGLDMRWRVGPFGLDPTVYYQWGTRDTQAFRTNGSVGKVESDMSAWLVDIIGSYQLGPLLLEARGVYTTGNKARDNLSRSIRYYQPLDADGSFFTGWASIFASGVDYFNGGFLPMTRWITYDRYGLATLSGRATYSITPAFSVYGIVAPMFTAEKVDVDTGVTPASTSANAGAGNVPRTVVYDKSFVEGDSRYLGTELNLGITWRFAPNTAFDLAGSYLFAGGALDTTEVLNGVPTTRSANDGYQIAARVRLAF
ncbi:MAG: hypothetical protein DMD87_04085 [Candidatus Rokuibacteriota bacterium]|nr:MAG: hypothetical protein DMD87_04085 [Candidatus Rokubacteria bacterium]